MSQRICTVLEVGPHIAMIAASAATEVGHLLRNFRSPSCDDEGDVSLVVKQQADGRIVIPAGLVPRIQAGLELMGHHVVVNDPTVYPLLQQAQKVVKDLCLRDADMDLVKAAIAASTQPRGQLISGDSRTRFDMIVLLCRLFPNAQVLVVSRNSHKAGELIERLRSAELNRPVGWIWECPPGGVGVCTPDKVPANPFWTVLIADGIHAIGTQAMSHAIRVNQHRYCVRPSEPLDDGEQLKLELLFGGIIHYSGYTTPPQVDVVIADSPDIEAPSGKRTALERKRQTIWHNEPRNRAIAEIALALVGKDTATLWNHGLFPGHDEQLMAQRLAGGRVAVHVDSPEHARQLHRLLPDWQFVTDVGNANGVIEDSFVGHQSIVTQTVAHSEGLHANIIVRACGTGSPLLIRGFPPEGRALIVDFNDDYDRRAVQETHDRVRNYRQAGLRVADFRPAPRPQIHLGAILCD